MNEHGVAFAYQQSSARSATPIGQVVALYDTILRDFRRAIEAAESGDVEKRVFELNHALTVIGYLQSILDHQRGGEAAKRLQRFYEVTHAMILQANANGNRDTLDRLIELYGPLRQAWQEAEKNLPAGASPVIPAVPSVANSAAPFAAAPKEELVEASRSNWSA